MKPEFPPALNGFFAPGPQHFVLYGGRGSGKSWSIATYIILQCLAAKEFVLCCREYQNSIEESVKRLLVNRIHHYGLEDRYLIRKTYLKSVNGSEIIFKGMFNNEEGIKGTEGVTIAWCEEAQTVSRKSLTSLHPTVMRNAGSRIFYTMNPRFEEDPVYQDFIAANMLPPMTRKMKINHDLNPWLSEEMTREMQHMRDTNFGMYRHVWEGDLLADDEARIFTNVTIEPFEAPEDADFMFGLDFGFSVDPTIGLRTFMSEDQKTIFVDYEAGGTTEIEIDEIPDIMLEGLPGIKYGVTIADGSRPETISHMNKLGISTQPAVKGKDSVIDGIAFLQSKKLVFHPRCKHIIRESAMYLYKRHPQTDKIMPVPKDENNHAFDALRYAWEGAWMPGAGFFAAIN